MVLSETMVASGSVLETVIGTDIVVEDVVEMEAVEAGLTSCSGSVAGVWQGYRGGYGRQGQHGSQQGDRVGLRRPCRRESRPNSVLIHPPGGASGEGRAVL